MPEEDAIFIVGEAKSPTNNPITERYGAFFIGLVLDPGDGRIIDAECSATLAITQRFIRGLLVGRRITDEDAITDRISTRYLGSSQKALIVAYRNALLKFHNFSATQ